jgi:hypothetical protein
MARSGDTEGVRIGRKYAHGRRVFPVAATEEAHAVIGRLDPAAASAARALLRRALPTDSISGVRVRPEEEQVAAVLAGCGILRLEEKVEGTAAVYHWRAYRAQIADGRRDEVRHTLGKLEPDHARRTLLASITSTSALSDEHDLLAAVPDGSPLRVPEGSRARTTKWSVYDAALRAAAGWYRATANDERLSARELAAKELGWSKAWTDARIAAFERIIGMTLEQAVETTEPEVRLRGPLRWIADDVIVDACAARPWVAIPARSAQQFGTLDYSDARGLLIIENLDTFEAICRHSDVPSTWLCLWGHGYVNNSLVSLVKLINKPTACWSDLDAHGVAIVGDIQARSGVAITPVFMTGQLHADSAFLEQDEEQCALASRLAVNGHPMLRDLAAQVARTEVGREQETMHHLIPQLGRHLAQVAARANAGGADAVPWPGGH